MNNNIWVFQNIRLNIWGPQHRKSGMEPLVLKFGSTPRAQRIVIIMAGVVLELLRMLQKVFGTVLP